MVLKMSSGGAVALDLGIWKFQAPPHQLRLLGEAKATAGNCSVVIVRDPQFNAETGTLTFDAEGIVVLNVGASSDAIAICAADRESAAPVSQGESQVLSVGPGDRDYLGLVDRLPEPARTAAKQILEEVRRRYPGDLKRGLRQNFSNTPDNFWYVVVQPRAGELSITVRGEPERFGGSVLDLKPDRPGYTRFKLSRPAEVPEAIRIIKDSKKAR